MVQANPHESGTTNTVEGIHPPLPACVYKSDVQTLTEHTDRYKKYLTCKENKLNSQAPYSAILLTCILSEAPDTVEQQDNAHSHEITTLHVETQTLSYDHNLGNSRFGFWMSFTSFLEAQPRGSVSRDRVKKILEAASPLSSHVSAVSLTVLVAGNWTVQCATRHVRTVLKLQNEVGLLNGHSNGFFCSNVLTTPLFTLHIWGCACGSLASFPGSSAPEREH